MRNQLSQSRLKELLHYDENTGLFTWVNNTSRRTRKGSTAGCVMSKGYIHIGVDGYQYVAHRLAWLYMHGAWPSKQIDHINGIRSDNSAKNLRLATNAENAQNTSTPKNNTSGYVGVTWDRKRSCWVAQISLNRKNHYLGSFSTAEEANSVRIKAKADMHKFQPFTRNSGGM